MELVNFLKDYPVPCVGIALFIMVLLVAADAFTDYRKIVEARRSKGVPDPTPEPTRAPQLQPKQTGRAE